MERLKDLRKKKNISMKLLGESLGVSESTISLYENDKRKPDPDMLIKLADYFSVSIDYLLDHAAPTAHSPAHDFTKEDVSLISAYRAAPENVQSAIDSLLGLSTPDAGRKNA